jgi:hypothetical protein
MDRDPQGVKRIRALTGSFSARGSISAHRSAEVEENVEGVTAVAAITSEMFEVIGISVGIGIVGVVHEMSSRGAKRRGLRHLAAPASAGVSPPPEAGVGGGFVLAFCT